MEMTKLESRLTRLEARLREMIEGDPVNTGIPRKLFRQLLHALVQAMQVEVNKNPQAGTGKSLPVKMPDLYTIVMPAEQARMLINHSETLDRLARKLEESAARANLRFSVSPILRVVPDPRAQSFHIIIGYSHNDGGDSYTAEMEKIPGLAISEKNGEMPNAFLIVNGLSTYPLEQALITIGRDPANQLILNDPRVSGVHAQLRLIKGHFMIFDLGSHMGTMVNGLVVSSHVLNPGDIILIAGVPLVYGEERPGEVGHTKKMPAEPAVPEML